MNDKTRNKYKSSTKRKSGNTGMLHTTDTILNVDPKQICAFSARSSKYDFHPPMHLR